MARVARSKETIKKNTIDDMKKLRTYKPEYNPIIEVYSEMWEQYYIYTKQLEDVNYKCDEITGAGGTKKSALVSTIETLRKDILAYSDRLQLNPKSLAIPVTEEKPQSKLAKALNALG
jgi:hypothetical protein